MIFNMIMIIFFLVIKKCVSERTQWQESLDGIFVFRFNKKLSLQFYLGEINTKKKKCIMTFCACDLTLFMYANVYLTKW